MTIPTLTKIAALSLVTLVTGACVADDDLDLDAPRGALLYDLNESELEQLHANYAADEDLELFRERLTAPFDCSFYDDFCTQVGRDAAYLITGEMVDLAFEGVSATAIDDHVSARIDEAAALADAVEGDDEFRAAGGWTTQTIGNFRLRVRRGITSPLWGDRRAWTEAKTQKKTLGIWSNKDATHLCVNAGTNTQVREIRSLSTGTNLLTLETINPGNSCNDLIKTKTVNTYHDRHNGSSGVGTSEKYIINSNGCGTAEINGQNFSACGSTFSRTF